MAAVSAEHVAPILMLSAQVRQRVSYPKLDKTELDDVLSAVDELGEWLSDHQLREQDFIRQAILDGLKQFRFRMTHIMWVGWGYTIESLREVIGAYLALERGLDPNDAPDAAATLKKIEIFVKTVYEKTGLVKDATETTGFLLKAYGAATLIAHGTGISGLLPLLQ